VRLLGGLGLRAVLCTPRKTEKGKGMISSYHRATGALRIRLVIKTSAPVAQLNFFFLAFLTEKSKDEEITDFLFSFFLTSSKVFRPKFGYCMFPDIF